MAVNYNIPFQTQLEYMMQELRGPESKTMDAFKSAGAITPQDYAELFEQKYERAGGHGLDRRKQYALEVFKAAGTDAFGNLPKNAQTAFNYFKGKGFTDAQAAGIVGNLMTESYAQIDPNAYNPAGGGMGAYGIAQFRGPRLKGLLEFAGQQGDKSMDGTNTAAQQAAAAANQAKPQGRMSKIKGLLDFASERNPETGLSRFEQFAAALDPLIMPQMRAGAAIQQRGAQRVQSARVNKTIEWLKKNGYPEIAAAVEANPKSAANVMSAVLAQRTKGTKQFRVATPEEAAKYGAEAGQFDDQGRFYPTQQVQKTQQLTGGEQKATGFFNRAYQSQIILNDLENQGTSMRNYIAGTVPFGNFLRTSEGQRYDQAKRDFINAILRQESGAVIGVDEFENAEKQYFPQPGDTADVIAQKRRNREAAIAGLKVASGPGAEMVGGGGNTGGKGNGFSVTGTVGGES
jgi:hypothetical protein